MGEQFLRKQAHSFRHRHDAAFSRMQVRDLLTATVPEVMAAEFRCETTSANEDIRPGEHVVLHASDGAVSVVQGNSTIGVVGTEETARLTETLARANGILRAVVKHRSAVSATFTVQLEVVP